jgi:hypothetical protein
MDSAEAPYIAPDAVPTPSKKVEVMRGPKIPEYVEIKIIRSIK